MTERSPITPAHRDALRGLGPDLPWQMWTIRGDSRWLVAVAGGVAVHWIQVHPYDKRFFLVMTAGVSDSNARFSVWSAGRDAALALPTRHWVSMLPEQEARCLGFPREPWLRVDHLTDLWVSTRRRS